MAPAAKSGIAIMSTNDNALVNTLVNIIIQVNIKLDQKSFLKTDIHQEYWLMYGKWLIYSCIIRINDC